MINSLLQFAIESRVKEPDATVIVSGYTKHDPRSIDTATGHLMARMEQYEYRGDHEAKHRHDDFDICVETISENEGTEHYHTVVTLLVNR